MLRIWALFGVLTLTVVGIGQTWSADWLRLVTAPATERNSPIALLPDGRGGHYLVTNEFCQVGSIFGRGVTVRRLDTVGAEIWSRTLQGITSNTGLVAVDSGGSLTLAGTNDFTSGLARLVSWRLDGAVRFNELHSLPTTGTYRPVALKADSAGRLVLLGTVQNLGETSTVLAGFSATGALLSRTPFAVPGTPVEGRNLVLEPGGTALFTAASTRSRSTWLVRMNPQSGAVLRSLEVGNTEQLGVDTAGRVFMVRFINGTPYLERRTAGLALEATVRIGPSFALVYEMLVLPNGDATVIVDVGTASRLVQVRLGQSARSYLPGTTVTLRALAADPVRNRIAALGNALVTVRGDNWTELHPPAMVSSRTVSRQIAFSTLGNPVLVRQEVANWALRQYSISQQRFVSEVEIPARPVNAVQGQFAVQGANGDVVTAAVRSLGSVRQVTFLTAMSPAGVRRWTRDLSVRTPQGVDTALASVRVVALGADYVVLGDAPGINSFYVARIRGSDGALVWARIQIPGVQVARVSEDGSQVAVVDGDVLLSLRSDADAASVLMRLDGATGNIRWRRSYTVFGSIALPLFVAATPGGGAIMAASGRGVPPRASTLDVLAYNPNGMLLWTRRLASVTTTRRLRVDGISSLPNGQFVVLSNAALGAAGSGDWTLHWLTGATGTLVRTRRFALLEREVPGRLLVDANGNVNVALSGTNSIGFPAMFITVSSYSGGTGAQRWAFSVAGPSATLRWSTTNFELGPAGTLILQVRRVEPAPGAPTHGTAAVLYRISPAGRILAAAVWGNRQPDGIFEPFGLAVGPAGEATSIATSDSIPNGLEVRLQRFTVP